MKKLAVIMPVYNASKYLDLAINSILEQSYNEFDFYIIDDNSLDDSYKIIKKHTDKRIVVAKNESNLGIAKTLNNTIKKIFSKYEYIARMDADDWSFPERFSKQIKFLEQNKNVLMCGAQGYWTPDFNNTPDFNWEYKCKYDELKISLLFSASFGHSSVIFRSEIFKKKLKYNTAISTCEDWHLWTELVLKGEIVNLPDFLMKYRVHKSSNHRNEYNLEIHFQERAKIISNYWRVFNTELTSDEIFNFYYSTNRINKKEFIMHLKSIIKIFNDLNNNNFNTLNKESKSYFQYRLLRFILSFWKRVNPESRKSILIWTLLIKKIKFSNIFFILKSMYR